MALKDILGRIASDAEAEAEAVRSEAKAEADAKLAAAAEEAARMRERVVGHARADAEREASTMAANARLRARDAALTARQALAADVLRAVEERLVALPDARYAEFIAREVAAAALGGETLLVGSADAARIRGPLEKALKSSGASVRVADGPAGIERGAVLQGDRSRVEVSPAATVAAARDELLAEADSLLFGGGGKV